MEATEDGVHEGLLVHYVDLGVASSAPSNSPSTQMTIEVGKFLLL